MKWPELELSPDEAQQLATALARVQKHYPNVNPLSEKHMALLGLTLCAGRIYGPRVAVLMTPKPKAVARTQAGAAVAPAPAAVPVPTAADLAQFSGPAGGWGPAPRE